MRGKGFLAEFQGGRSRWLVPAAATGRHLPPAHQDQHQLQMEERDQYDQLRAHKDQVCQEAAELQRLSTLI